VEGEASTVLRELSRWVVELGISGAKFSFAILVLSQHGQHPYE
jgi:hypothetical protein